MAMHDYDYIREEILYYIGHDVHVGTLMWGLFNLYILLHICMPMSDNIYMLIEVARFDKGHATPHLINLFLDMRVTSDIQVHGLCY